VQLAALEMIDVAAPLAQPFHWATGTATERRVTLVRVRTASGVEGWGESAHGRIGGAIDIALRDAAAREAGVPLAAMLSARPAREVAVYASGLYYGEGDEPAEARRHLDAGFTRVKMKIGRGSRAEDLLRIAAVRSAIGDAELMVDANGAYDLAAALTIAPALGELGVRWLEEPLALADVAGYGALRVRRAIPIAAGESLASDTLRYWIDGGLLDVVQPNVAACGGVAAACEVLRHAAQRGLRLAIHAWGTPIITAAALHVAAACADCGSSPIVEIDRTPNPLRAVSRDFAVREGFIALPDGPGLGVEIDLAAVEEYRVRSAA